MRKTMFSVLGTLVFLVTPAFAQTGSTTEGGTTPRGFQQQLGEDQPDRQLGEQRETRQAGQRQQSQQAGQTQQREGQQTTQRQTTQRREGQQTTQREIEQRDGEQTTRQRTTRQQTTLDQDRQDGAQVQVQERQRRQAQGDTEQPVTGPAMRASDLTGLEVRNHLDEDLGTVDDLVIDLRTGQIRYVALRVGGVLGIGADRYAVPWGAFRLQGAEGDRHLVINATEAQFENAPGFDDDNWPDMANQQWVTTNDAFYTESGIYTTRQTTDRPRSGVRRTTDQQLDTTRQRTDRTRQTTEQQDSLRLDTDRRDGERTGTTRQGTTRRDRGVQSETDVDVDLDRTQEGAAAPRRTPRATGTQGADSDAATRAGARAGTRSGTQQDESAQEPADTDSDN